MQPDFKTTTESGFLIHGTSWPLHVRNPFGEWRGGGGVDANFPRVESLEREPGRGAGQRDWKAASEGFSWMLSVLPRPTIRPYARRFSRWTPWWKPLGTPAQPSTITPAASGSIWKWCSHQRELSWGRESPSISLKNPELYSRQRRCPSTLSPFVCLFFALPI